MIVEYAINPRHGDLGQAYILASDLLSRKPVIYLGGTLEIMNQIMRGDPSRIDNKRIFEVGSWEAFYEEDCGRLITHEVLHIVIFDITDSERACRAFDHIDGGYNRISNCGFDFAVCDERRE